MKKDIEWLKKEIEEYLEYEGVRDARIALESVLGYIDQLDEPEVKQLDKKIKELDSYNDELIRDNNQLRNEMDNKEVLSQKWIDEHKYFAEEKIGEDAVVKARDLRDILVPKQDKPVIPKFVANFIRATKPNNSLRLAFEYIAQQKIDNYDDGLAFWIEEGNSELFARAWIYGYEVEKEPQWVVKQKKLYLKSFDIWREEDNNVEFVLDKESTIKFSDKAKAEAVAILVDGEVEEVT